MLGTYFYHEILRKTVIGFGTLFNNINIRHKDASGTNFSVMKVPLAYGPMQKFLARIQQQPDLNREIAITLPRLSFEMQGIQYDPTRKTGIAQTFLAKSGTTAKKVYMLVPYNVGFELSIMSKLSDDALQILEQIVPYFQPSFNITINLIDSIGEKKDIPIVLESINQSDQYEGSFETRRTIIYTYHLLQKLIYSGQLQMIQQVLSRKLMLITMVVQISKLRREFKDIVRHLLLNKIMMMTQRQFLMVLSLRRLHSLKLVQPPI